MPSIRELQGFPGLRQTDAGQSQIGIRQGHGKEKRLMAKKKKKKGGKPPIDY
jgi:hypothetical protein